MHLFERMTALVVDDTATSRQFVSRILQSELHFQKVLQAANAREGLARLNEDTAIDLIICDWEMPKISGLSFLNRLKEDDRWRSIPFIMATSRSDKSSILKAIEAGVNDYVTKPFSGQTLEAKIERLFNGSQDSHKADHKKVLIKSPSTECAALLMEISADSCRLKSKCLADMGVELSDAKIFFSQKRDSFFVNASLTNIDPISESDLVLVDFSFYDLDADTKEKLKKLISTHHAN